MTDDPIGYKKPPKHTRWTKGQSGNPKGRAKGQRNLKTDLIAELNESVQLNEGGVHRRLTKQRALLKALAARAIGGDGRAASLVLNLMLRVIDPEPETPQAEPLTADDQALIEAFLARHTQSKGSNND